MRWKDLRRSVNVEDRRAEDGGGGFGIPTGGGGMAVPITGAGGCGLLLVIVLVIVLGGDPSALLGGLTGGSTVDPTGGQAQPAPLPAESDETAQFVRAVLGSTEDVWSKQFQQAGLPYHPPTLVLFTDLTQTGCGTGEAATGPFYCPNDERLYLDLGFLNDLKRLGAPGDFALAYVVAHEVGHHVQHLEGTDTQVQRMRERLTQADANALSVLTELQADCYAGVWGHDVNAEQAVLEEGDIEEGLQAAAAVGDDRLLKMAGRRVVRDAFTHGSSEERASWLRRGLESGNTDACDTFGEAGLR